MTQICFVVLNYNGFDETKKLVSSIASWDKSKLDYHVVIVDNCSTDDSFTRLSQCFTSCERVDVIESEHNGGYSYGNNLGAKYAIDRYNPRYIAISNPDIEIDCDTLLKLLDTFDADERIAMCAPIMKAIDGNYRVYTQSLPTFQDDLKACSIWNKSKTLNEVCQTLKGYDNCILTEMIPGSFFVIRADYFAAIGMFDENVFLYCEERILGKRLKTAGFLSVKRKDLFYVHAHAVTTSKAYSSIQRWRILLKSRLYYQKEYNRIESILLLVLKLAMYLFLLQLSLLNRIRHN